MRFGPVTYTGHHEAGLQFHPNHILGNLNQKTTKCAHGQLLLVIQIGLELLKALQYKIYSLCHGYNNNLSSETEYFTIFTRPKT